MADRETFTTRPVLDTGNLSRTKVRTKARKVWAFMVAVFCVFLSTFGFVVFNRFPWLPDMRTYPTESKEHAIADKTKLFRKSKFDLPQCPDFQGEVNIIHSAHIYTLSSAHVLYVFYI